MAAFKQSRDTGNMKVLRTYQPINLLTGVSSRAKEMITHLKIPVNVGEHLTNHF